jgi:hypothetical protein
LLPKMNMNKFFFVITAILFLFVFHSACQAGEGYELLFQGTKSKLTRQEKEQIFDKMDFRLSWNKKKIEQKFYGDVSPRVDIVDLNKDGAEEVFINWGNSQTSGITGYSVTLFIRDRNGRFVKNLDFPGSYKILATQRKGFPDLLITGRGHCFAVWQWSGTLYEFKCAREMKPGGCAGMDIKICK